MSVSRGCSRDAPARMGEAAGQAWTQPYWERTSLISPLELLFIFVKGGFVLRSLCAKKGGGDMERMGDSRFLLYVCRSFDGIRGR